MIRDPRSGIRDPESWIRKKLIPDPDPGVKKAPNPGSGSATQPKTDKMSKLQKPEKILSVFY